MQIQALLQKGKELLNQANIEDATIQTKQLLKHILNVDSSYLIINNMQDVEKEIEEKFLNGVQSIIKGVPLQYITNNQEFMGLKFYVDENVLIPQPDTETLIEEVINRFGTKKNLRILDMCTGSGAIAISLAKYMDESVQIDAVDISKKALDVARKNARLNDVLNIKFIESDMFEKINELYDIIVSNPPYIETKTINELSIPVQNEPHLALDGGEDGLDFYRIILEQSINYLKKQGTIVLEIGYNQKEEIFNIIQQNKNYKEHVCIKDLSGNDRTIIVKIK